MLSLQKICSRVRGQNPINAPENREYEQITMETTGALETAQGLPQRAEIVRLGDSWVVQGAASTGLTAVPTTAGLVTLWNGEPGNGKIYAIDRVVATKVIVDVTTDDLFTVWAQIIRAPMATPTDAGLTIRSLNGKYTYGGRARTVATSTTLANRWEPIGAGNDQAPAIAGSAWQQIDIDLLGRYIITPGSAFTLHASEVTATASTFRFTIFWHEVQIPYVS